MSMYSIYIEPSSNTMQKHAHKKIVEYILWRGNRDYHNTVRRFVPLIPRDAVEFSDIVDVVEYGDMSVTGVAALQELALRLFPDKFHLDMIERWSQKSLPRVKVLLDRLYESRCRSIYAQLRSMIFEAQGE